MVEDASGDAWVAFYQHYWKLVYTWALRRLDREHSAEEVAVEVFAALFRRITKDQLDPVEPDAQGSFRPFVYTVVKHLCTGYRRNEARRARLGLSLTDVARLEEPASIGDLCEHIAAREELELRMDRYKEAYDAAFHRLKAAPQFDPRTLAAFLRVAYTGRKHKEVDAEFGQNPGWSSKTSARVRERLLALFLDQDGRGESARTELDPILDDLVWIHGDPSV